MNRYNRIIAGKLTITLYFTLSDVNVGCTLGTPATRHVSFGQICSAVRAVPLKEKLQIKIASSSSHTIITESH